MKSQWTKLFHALALDCADACGAKYIERDIAYATSRAEHEGDSFYEITLPKFGKAFTGSLQTGKFDDDLRAYFKFRGGLPHFLWGFLRQVFDDDGVLLNEPNVHAIRAVRQLTLAFGKVRKACSPDKERAAMDAYVQIENELMELDLPDLNRFRRIALLVYGDIFSEVDLEVYHGNLRPYPGPGATAEKLSYNKRFYLSAWNERLEWDFPYALYGRPTWTDGFDNPPSILSPEHELPDRVVAVPKTQETPRIISIQPAVMQNAQQAVMRELVPRLERLPHNPLGFVDQTINQRMAQKASVDGLVSTLDLSEASDRVSNVLVHALLDGFPNLDGLVQSCRSVSADVPGHGNVPLTKFASMGSALTFPVEAMVFLTIVLEAMLDARNAPLTTKSLSRLMSEVRIYGDDILVPVDCTPFVVDYLHAYGLKVNTQKSFSAGNFRESCGGDYFNGTNVTPVRIRHVVPTSRLHAIEIAGWFSTLNQLDEAGLVRSADFVHNQLSRFVAVKGVPAFSSALGRHSLAVKVEKWDPDLQRGLIKAPVLVSKPPVDRLDGYGALHKWILTKRLLQENFDSLTTLERLLKEEMQERVDTIHRKVDLSDDHLIHAGRSKSANIKLRWVVA